ncbi:MAG: hypothetical protein QF415_12900 [Candidatus Undinarchaeales archaeon]|jgi:hypothetical protein|nr:hypothetical protein [Candidatus Undinarchaeales archaeon]MDP7491507.1 hypothetical protein [Candidatus Undinarchaeales archaeon]
MDLEPYTDAIGMSVVRTGSARVLPTIAVVLPVFLIIILYISLLFSGGPYWLLPALGLGGVVAVHVPLVAALRSEAVQKASEEHRGNPEVWTGLLAILLLLVLRLIVKALEPLNSSGLAAFLGVLPPAGEMAQGMALIMTVNFGFVVYEQWALAGREENTGGMTAVVASVLFLGAAFTFAGSPGGETFLVSLSDIPSTVAPGDPLVVEGVVSTPGGLSGSTFSVGIGLEWDGSAPSGWVPCSVDERCGMCACATAQADGTWRIGIDAPREPGAFVLRVVVQNGDTGKEVERTARVSVL